MNKLSHRAAAHTKDVPFTDDGDPLRIEPVGSVRGKEKAASGRTAGGMIHSVHSAYYPTNPPILLRASSSRTTSESRFIPSSIFSSVTTE